MARMAEGLAGAGHEVRVLAAATPKHPGGDRAPAGIHAESVPVDTSVRPLRLAVSLASRAPYATARFASAPLAARLEALLGAERWDVVQLEGLGVYPLARRVRALSRARLVVRAHNVEHALFRERASRAASPLAAAFLRLEARRVAHLERQTWSLAHGVAAIAPEVARACAAAVRVPVATIPVGVEVPDAPPAPGDPSDVLHLAAMDWWPNREGLEWFLAEAWPRVRRERPSARLRLAGRGMTGFARGRSWPGVAVEGEVPDAATFLRSSPVVVVPLLSGSGVRVKVVEAMALGRAVVATPRAAEGLGRIEPGRHLLLGDGPDALAAGLVRALADPGLAARLGEAAWLLARERFSAPAVARAVDSLYHSLPSEAA